LVTGLTKDQIIDSWFIESEVDLQCAKLLFDNCIYSRSLYHLQQSNEKLAKGLLLSIGILTPRKHIQNQKLKSLIGFMPKEPSAYRHRTLPFFLSDMSAAAPAIEEIAKSIDWKGAEDIFLSFRATIKNSKKGIEKLKKKPFSLIANNEQLETEIKAINQYLFNLDKVKDAIKAAINNLNPQKATQVAINTVHKLGFEATNDQALESYYRTTERSLRVMNLGFLVALSIAAASFLDPLESITRYPDSNHAPFTKGDIYVDHFQNLHEIIKKTLQKAIIIQKELTENKLSDPFYTK
jgi:HEPN domain-containing protein